METLPSGWESADTPLTPASAEFIWGAYSESIDGRVDVLSPRSNDHYLVRLCRPSGGLDPEFAGTFDHYDTKSDAVKIAQQLISLSQTQPPADPAHPLSYAINALAPQFEAEETPDSKTVAEILLDETVLAQGESPTAICSLSGDYLSATFTETPEVCVYAAGDEFHGYTPLAIYQSDLAPPSLDTVDERLGDLATHISGSHVELVATGELKKRTEDAYQVLYLDSIREVDRREQQMTKSSNRLGHLTA